VVAHLAEEEVGCLFDHVVGPSRSPIVDDDHIHATRRREPAGGVGHRGEETP
jgi:hypothetical protein